LVMGGTLVVVTWALSERSQELSSRKFLGVEAR
jgi:hypothetical protein